MCVPYIPPLKANLRDQLDKWLQDEVIEPSNSPWSSTLVPVTKKTGTIWWVLDFRAVNSVTAADSYPCLNISDILSSLGKSTFLSTLDASSAYNVIPVSLESRPITAFTTIFGLFQFAHMPFGLKIAGAAYFRLVQRMIDMLGVEGVLAYLDDLFIHTDNLETHLKLLDLVFQAQQESGIQLNAEKTHLFRTEVEYLGHLINAEGIKLVPSYV